MSALSCSRASTRRKGVGLSDPTLVSLSKQLLALREGERLDGDAAATYG
jgi:hypothetical protein